MFEFSVPSGSSHLFLPPNVVESDYTADQCIAMRDPATFGNYVQVRDLVSTKVIPGYNSPTDIAIQLTEEINEKKQIAINIIIVRQQQIIKKLILMNGSK